MSFQYWPLEQQESLYANSKHTCTPHTCPDPFFIPFPDQLVITKYPHATYAKYGARPALIPVRVNPSSKSRDIV